MKPKTFGGIPKVERSAIFLKNTAESPNTGGAVRDGKNRGDSRPKETP